MISETIITLRDVRRKNGVEQKLVQFSRVEYDDDMNIVDGSAVQGEEWRPVEDVNDDDIAVTEQAQEQIATAISAKRRPMPMPMPPVVVAPFDPVEPAPVEPAPVEPVEPVEPADPVASGSASFTGRATADDVPITA